MRIIVKPYNTMVQCKYLSYPGIVRYLKRELGGWACPGMQVTG